MKFTIKAGGVVTVALLGAAVAVAAVSQSGPAAAQDLPGGTWGPALALNLSAAAPAGAQLASAGIDDVSCASPGNCAAIGTSFSHTSPGGADAPYPFVVSETAGEWGTPEAVAGVTSSTPIQGGPLARVSCAAPGECAATWTYDDANGDGHAYLADESNGAWGQAQPVVMGTVDTSLTSVSCPAPGDCTATGDYLSGPVGSGLPFVMDSSDGTWGTPHEVSGVAGLSSPAPLNASVSSVSCASAGNCVAGGSFRAASVGGISQGQPFIAVETAGTWGAAQLMPGITTLISGGWANLFSVSCQGNGDCTGLGYYATPAGGDFSWVASESGGTWGPAQQLPAPTVPSETEGSSLSCSPQGYCAVAGRYVSAAAGSLPKAFVATNAGGTWTAQDLPGIVADLSFASTVSCGAPGYCSVDGQYNPPGSGQYKVFIASEANGAWASAQDPAGAPGGLPALGGLSCTGPGYCTAVGRASGETYTLSEGTAATVTLQASAPTVTYGNEQAETLTATVGSPDAGTPTGTVAITDGKLAVCRITLAGGTGQCTLPPAAIPAGSDQLSATYLGDANYTVAISADTVTVATATTTAAMTVSPATVTYNTSTTVMATVRVAPQFAGVATGWVTVDLNGSRGCVISLVDGQGSCSVPWGQDAGRYKLAASYGGDGNFTGSTTSAQYLTVARLKTSTRLALSKATISYGHEAAEKLTVTISTPVVNDATGKVTIRTGQTTICVITLKPGNQSSGSCTLRATQLRPGTYRLTASYPGDVNNVGSVSSIHVLKVVS